MKGINHERVNFLVLLPVIYILGYKHLDILQSVSFITLWIIGTRYITPDLDTNSRSRKRLHLLGWVIDKLFKHRGALHNPILWIGMGAVGYYFIGWVWIGLIIPQMLHIICDI